MSRGISKITGITVETYSNVPIEFVAYDARELSRANGGAPVRFTHDGIEMTVGPDTSLHDAANWWVRQHEGERQKANDVPRPYSHE